MTVMAFGRSIYEAILFGVILTTIQGTAESGTCYHKIYAGNYEGSIWSPNYPNPYPRNTHCTWDIYAPQDHVVKLVFQYYEIINCQDYVTLYDGDPDNPYSFGVFLGKFCFKPTRAITTSSDRIRVVFRSGPSNYWNKGFKICYSAVPRWGYGCGLPSERSGQNSPVPRSGYGCGLPSERSRQNSPESEFCDALIEFDHDTLDETDLNDNLTDCVGRYLTRYLLTTKRQPKASINKWGSDVSKSAVALFLQDTEFFTANNGIGEEVTYELTLQLISELVLKKRISSMDLALFLNAMTVACINQKTFYGIDVVAELRERVNNSNRPDPFFLLSLCIAGEELTTEDVQILQHMFHDDIRTETQAMVVLALKCIRNPPKYLEATLTEMVSELKAKQLQNGTVGDLQNSALVIQSLLATGSHTTEFSMKSAIKSIISSINPANLTTEEIYYVMPVVKGKSLLDINSFHCESFIKTDLEEDVSSLREHFHDLIEVHISIIVGIDKNFSRSWKMIVPPSYSLYEALEDIALSDPDYKFRYLISNGKPYLDGVSNFQDRASHDGYWFVYTKPLYTNADPVFVNGSPVDIKLNENEEVILWYKS